MGRPGLIPPRVIRAIKNDPGTGSTITDEADGVMGPAVPVSGKPGATCGTGLLLDILVGMFPWEIMAGVPPDGQCGRACSCHRAPPAGVMHVRAPSPGDARAEHPGSFRGEIAGGRRPGPSMIGAGMHAIAGIIKRTGCGLGQKPSYICVIWALGCVPQT